MSKRTLHRVERTREVAQVEVCRGQDPMPFHSGKHIALSICDLRDLSGDRECLAQLTPLFCKKPDTAHDTHAVCCIPDVPAQRMRASEGLTYFRCGVAKSVHVTHTEGHTHLNFRDVPLNCLGKRCEERHSLVE
jgi:hypothetical protein